MARKGRKITFRFNCLLQKEGERYVGYCKETGTSSFGSTVGEARQNLEDALSTLFEYAIDNDRIDLLSKGCSFRVKSKFFYAEVACLRRGLLENGKVLNTENRQVFAQTCCT
jgi:predicted RNase H-like HicB family nuclease